MSNLKQYLSSILQMESDHTTLRFKGWLQCFQGLHVQDFACNIALQHHSPLTQHTTHKWLTS